MTVINLRPLESQEWCWHLLLMSECSNLNQLLTLWNLITSLWTVNYFMISISLINRFWFDFKVLIKLTENFWRGNPHYGSTKNGWDWQCLCEMLRRTKLKLLITWWNRRLDVNLNEIGMTWYLYQMLKEYSMDYKEAL